VDLAWISTALRHFSDVDRAFDELNRVFRAEGRVLVGAYAPDRTKVTWAEEFPGRVKWQRRFLDSASFVSLLSNMVFRDAGSSEVLEWTESCETSPQWVEPMRDADSMLTALTNIEIEQGPATLRADPAREGRMELSLFVFEKR
jgi:hypothetical protein